MRTILILPYTSRVNYHLYAYTVNKNTWCSKILIGLFLNFLVALLHYLLVYSHHTTRTQIMPFLTTFSALMMSIYIKLNGRIIYAGLAQLRYSYKKRAYLVISYLASHTLHLWEMQISLMTWLNFPPLMLYQALRIKRLWWEGGWRVVGPQHDG